MSGTFTRRRWTDFDAKLSIAVALAALVVAFVLLLAISLVAGRRGRERAVQPLATTPGPATVAP